MVTYSFTGTQLTQDAPTYQPRNVTPDRAQPPVVEYDTVEWSPNSRARCRTCLEKIPRGIPRVCKKKIQCNRKDYSLEYHHESCCTEEFLRTLVFQGGRSLAEEFDRKTVLARNERKTIQERNDLRQALLEYRTHQQNQSGLEYYRIFRNTALDEIVLKLPTTLQCLIKCKGIGPTNLRRHGEAIIEIVKMHRRKYTI